MKKWAFLFMFFAFGHDVIVDNLMADCNPSQSDAACHMCVCQNHFVPKSDVKPQGIVPAPNKFVPVLDENLTKIELVKSCFHPPK